MAKKKAQTESEPFPVGVKLSALELERLAQMAAEVGVSRHQLLQYAVRDYMRRWDAGERPRTKTETVLDM